MQRGQPPRYLLVDHGTQQQYDGEPDPQRESEEHRGPVTLKTSEIGTVAFTSSLGVPCETPIRKGCRRRRPQAKRSRPVPLECQPVLVLEEKPSSLGVQR